MAPKIAPTPGPNLTFVSRCGTGLMTIMSFFRLVRSSHYCAFVVLALLIPGCIFPEPPAWEGAKKTQPQLSPLVPLTDQFVVLSYNQLQRFEVSERSEDAGEALRAIWSVDGVYKNSIDIAPGHINDVKTIQAPWTVDTKDPECVPFALVVTHVSNDRSNYAGIDSGTPDHSPIDLNDASTMIWWLNLNDATGCRRGTTN